jgi:8-oxo-dGTP diphosphatase
VIELRLLIAKLVEEITPLDDLEESHQFFVKNWITSGADLFRIKKPAFPETHLVSYFVPFDELNKKICLVHHKKANLWIPPGGHVDIDEHPQDTVYREMQEELTEQAICHHEAPFFVTVAKTVNDPLPHTDVSLWYVVKGDSWKKYRFDSREFHDVSWFNIYEPHKDITEPTLIRFIQKLKRLLQKPQKTA